MPAVLWTYQALPARVIDGDTLELVVDLGFGLHKAGVDNHFRVKGVDTPELRGVTRLAGQAAKEFVQSWVYAAEGEWPLIIQTEKRLNREVRTFERWVARIWRRHDGAYLAENLIAAGHGVAIGET